MIFLSHTHADKPIVDNLANTLRAVFGVDNVFYDSWSIKPGDGIIDKMNTGLSSCKYFFFFISTNSLKSEMVKLEWQNALYNSIKEEIKFIPVRLDNCTLPPLISQKLYIDLFSNGPEAAIKQMIDVINNLNTYVPLQKFQNIQAYLKKEADKLTIEFRAEVHMEPHSKYAILVTNPKEELNFSALGESMFDSSFNENIKLDNGQLVNIIVIGRQTATSPGFPFVVEIKAQNQKAVELYGISRFTSRDRLEAIPVITL